MTENIGGRAGGWRAIAMVVAVLALVSCSQQQEDASDVSAVESGMAAATDSGTSVPGGAAAAQTPPRGGVAATQIPAPGGVAGYQTPAPDSGNAEARDASVVPPDEAVSDASAARAATSESSVAAAVRTPDGRSRRDSLGLARAVRSGMAIEAWPESPAASQPGAIMPHKRIVAYYGNPLSRRMGALGQYPVDEMLERLDREVQAWREADPATPVQPALHLVAVVAQADSGRDGKYRARMADTLVERVYQWAQSIDALLFLDIQVGLASIQEELPRLEKFLSRPDVHLGIDPEFSMKTGARPGTRIGTFDAADINHTSRFLADVVERHNLPPKVLVVHRFTQSMVTNAGDIQLNPAVQVVMHMDGWGPPWLKYDSYREFVLREPVEFTGFKIFYGNDTRTGTSILTPMELVQLVPAPMYVQYQ